MKIHTATLGVVEAAPESFLTLPDGLIGFEEHKEFALLELADYRPFRWLQSFSDPGLSFPVLDPHAFVPAYEPSLSEADRAGLGFDPGETPLFYAIATVEDAGKSVTINLRAPLVVHPTRRIARQVVLADSRWEIQHPILERARRAAPARAKASH
ncbi:MAG TPA: flagellar assembly protein FliW [Candidatus Eisenbacteria bacterium]|nr:flagellar assembly protein FliW [Candidatus Eisenbacteria bacterium]